MYQLIKIKCTACVDGVVTKSREVPPGSGNAVETQEDCTVPSCDAGWKTFDIESRIELPDGMYHSVEVFEAIDTTEYIALTTPKSQEIDTMIGAGFVNLNDGSRGKTTLWDLFPDGTTTRANLVALIA